ncbi:hypothetical protein [Phaeovulum sp. NW3]|uniref:hypothetical protein n=1 Tax=Phaeovulum sp. NW3 TaxID=2934933 RepID=UPI0020201E39|nr:hypothetical protein [Phaeovulum sp. NW3]
MDVEFKDVTYETLQDPEFLVAVRAAFPGHDWDKAHEEYKAAGETKNNSAKG